jgi:hypothetical protein
MNRLILSALLLFLFGVAGYSQDLVAAANAFIGTLEPKQKEKALFPFDTEERYTFYFVPRDDRKGIDMNALNSQQKKAAFDLLKTCLSVQGVTKVSQIMEMETLLKAIEKRKEEDHYRDTGKYFISLFGIPGEKNIWGWRFEGHHLSFHFSAKDNKLLAGTPGFLGSNPGIVLDGPQKGKQILKDETEMGFAMLNTLSKDALQKALIDSIAPNEILTVNYRKAMLEHPAGILYAEMTKSQQQQLLQLINLYIHRYTKLFADDMLKEIQEAGLDKLRFAWAGSTQPILGKAYYYRVQGPTIIIELDNSQNNANHIHTVVRDLKHDFGGDLLLEHYRSSVH